MTLKIFKRYSIYNSQDAKQPRREVAFF